MENKCGAAERTRKNLIQAFWRCYEEKPFTEVTVKSVTQVAGYNRSTFYQYFDNMNDLMEQAEDELLEHLRKIAEETIAGGLSEIEMERGLGRWADECGQELRTVVGPWGDLRFLARFKELLNSLNSHVGVDQQDAELLIEFTSAILVSASAYYSARPDADRARVIHVLHAYIHGGSMSLLTLP